MPSARFNGIRVVAAGLGLVSTASAHGVMCEPPACGAWGHRRYCKELGPAPKGYKTDFRGHFPTGSRSDEPGAGKGNMEALSGGQFYPYAPMDGLFRAGINMCGDLESGGGDDHLSGGRFGNSCPVRSYPEGDVVNVRFDIGPNHGGYVEAHVCDVSMCDGDMNRECFRQGHCVRLNAEPRPECEMGTSSNCLPVDPRYPSRQMVTCFPGGMANQGHHYVFDLPFRLPSGFHCDNCVLQAYWLAADGCTPEGLTEYWERNPGALGRCGRDVRKLPFKRFAKVCGTRNASFPEEYFQCARISISASGGGVRRQDIEPAPIPEDITAPESIKPASTPAEIPGSPAPAASGECQPGPLDGFFLVADGAQVRAVSDGDVIDVSQYGEFSIEAAVRYGSKVRGVEFTIDGRQARRERLPPYTLPRKAGRIPLNMPFHVVASTEGGCLSAIVTLQA